MSKPKRERMGQQPAAMVSATSGDTPIPEGGSRQRCTLTAELLEDAHLGSGAGGAGVNALLARDRREHPVIWASHLEGLLREAATSLHGHDAANELFGQAGGLRQKAVFTSLYCDTAPPRRIWRSTARKSFRNRAPEDDTLRAVELVPRGTRFTGHVELPGSEMIGLERLLMEVDAVGHGRQSGAGRVRFCLDLATRTKREVGIVKGASSLRLLLHNLDPLCIAATATPGNLIRTEPFVPGRTLLGALTNWLLNDQQREAAALLVSGDISVSDALPLPWSDPSEVKSLSMLEVLPAPLALKTPKPQGAAGAGPWWCWEDPAARWNFRPDTREGTGSATAGKRAEGNLKRPSPDLFLARLGAETWRDYRPVLRVRLRNGRPDPDQSDPSLFAIEQIAERTCFLAELRGDPASLQRVSDALRPVLEGRCWLRVGRAGAPVEIARATFAALTEAAPMRRPLNAGYLTLTSDLLVRDEQLRWCTALSGEDFTKLPWWPDDITVTPESQERTAVHGFNGTARLWRLPAAGIRRGSVFRVEGSGVAALMAAATAGKWLGERTHEGFGRFRVDEHLPGISPATGQAEVAKRATAAKDDGDEAICSRTKAWLASHGALTKPGSNRDRRPSLSQWMDLVNELRGGDKGALARRQRPETAGAASWQHVDAAAILEKLRALGAIESQGTHAEMFVRWLRASMRQERSKPRPARPTSTTRTEAQ